MQYLGNCLAVRNAEVLQQRISVACICWCPKHEIQTTSETLGADEYYKKVQTHASSMQLPGFLDIGKTD